MKLNLGCGQKKLINYINLDINPLVKPDKIIDLEKTPYPFDSCSISEIILDNTLEHIKNYEKVIIECHRILKYWSEIKIIVPYCTSIGAEYEDHKIRCRYSFLEDFEKNNGRSIRDDLPKFRIKRKLIFTPKLKIIEKILNKHPKLIMYYEDSGLRFLFPAKKIRIIMTK